MASSTLTADRRWASSRKSGMTVLGKVPKPINLPSQRLENNGLDPNVEIVPKGTITWGSRPSSSSNPWNSSSSSSSILSPKIEAASSSPPDLMGRPGSSGSSTRPSTGNTDRQLNSDPSSHAWGPNSRPSSASGSFASGHPLASPNRPRSADTRPGSSQLSRFAESSGESKGFTLSSGDFPTLGAEKPTDPRRGHSSHGRPTSGAGRDAGPKEALDNLQPGHDLHMRPTSGEDNMTKAPNAGDSAKTTDGPPPKTQNVNILKTDDPPNTTNWYSETPYQYHPSHPYHQPGPNQPNTVLPIPIPAPQYDNSSSWRSPAPQPMQQQTPPEGTMWYPPGPRAPGPHGPGPYRPSGPPNNYPIDPFVYYSPPPHFRPPNAESAPRPHMPPPHNPYMMPAHPVSIPARHGPHGPHAPYAPVAAPVSYDGGFYGPRAAAGFYGNHGHNHNNNRSNFNNSNNNNQQAILSQGQNQSPRSSASGSDAAPKQYKVLLKHREEEKRDEKQPEPTVITRSKEHSSEHSENQQQPIVKKNSALIQKIGELNSKARNLESSSHAELKEERPKPGEGILGTPSGIIGVEVAAVRQHHAERRLNEQRRTRQRPAVQAPNHVVPVKTEAVLDNVSITGSDKVVSVRNEGDEGMASDVNLPPLDPAEYEIQRALLKEKAAQRAKELQREEEERIREQKAKALAKLEALNRRATTQKEPVVQKESESEPSIVITAADKHIQEIPQEKAESSSLSTVILSFGTISEVQITTGKVTHISEVVPISSIKTSVDAVAVASSGTGTGTSSHARHHHHAKHMGYKKRHSSSNLNAPVEVRGAEKVINVENLTEPLKQTDAQGPAAGDNSTTQHKDDTVSLQRKKGSRNPKNRIKTEVPMPMPVSVPVQSVAPLEERPGKGLLLNEKIQPGTSNSISPENSGKEDLKPIEGEYRSGSGNNNNNNNNNNNRAGPHWKAQQQQRRPPVRNNRPSSEKSHGNHETVMWAPVKHPKEEITRSVGININEAAAAAVPKIDVEVHAAGTKTKRAEIERYVPKPQLSQMEKKPDDESTDVKTGETSSPSEAKAAEEVINSRTTVIGSDGTNNNVNKSVRRGGSKPHASWRQRVVPSETHETMFQNPTDSEKTPAFNSQAVVPSSARKEYEDIINPDGRPKRQSGHKLYKATGSNYYTGHGTGRSETENVGEIVDGTVTGTEGSSEVSNYGSNNNRSQHWKPRSQSHVHSHGRGNNVTNVGWQKVVVSDKPGPVSGKIQDEDNNKPVTSVNAEDINITNVAPRRQRGNARQYRSGEERETNRDPQAAVESYQRVIGEDGTEGSRRVVASGSRYRGRGRNGNFARRASELSI